MSDEDDFDPNEYSGVFETPDLDFETGIEEPFQNLGLGNEFQPAPLVAISKVLNASFRNRPPAGLLSTDQVEVAEQEKAQQKDQQKAQQKAGSQNSQLTPPEHLARAGLHPLATSPSSAVVRVVYSIPLNRVTVKQEDWRKFGGRTTFYIWNKMLEKTTRQITYSPPKAPFVVPLNEGDLSTWIYLDLAGPVLECVNDLVSQHAERKEKKNRQRETKPKIYPVELHWETPITRLRSDLIFSSYGPRATRKADPALWTAALKSGWLKDDMKKGFAGVELKFIELDSQHFQDFTNEIASQKKSTLQGRNLGDFFAHGPKKHYLNLIGQIAIYAGNYKVRNWLLTNGEHHFGLRFSGVLDSKMTALNVQWCEITHKEVRKALWWFVVSDLEENFLVSCSSS